MNQMLIVDDDNEFREMLVKTLKSQGYRAIGISDPNALASMIVVHQPQVILLDMMFGSEFGGLEACQRLSQWSALPVIMLSVIDDEAMKVHALDAGADDYITKPFGISELLARVRAVQRRIDHYGSPNPVIALGDLVIDLDAHQVRLQNKLIHLTRKEYALLKILAESGGRLVTYEKLMIAIWNTQNTADRAKVRGLVMQVRSKLGEDLGHPHYILTEAGVGCRLNLENDTP
jgi:two-component system, OmpR family, KDP operon response regulator KdpE